MLRKYLLNYTLQTSKTFLSLSSQSDITLLETELKKADMYGATVVSKCRLSRKLWWLMLKRISSESRGFYLHDGMSSDMGSLFLFLEPHILQPFTGKKAAAWWPLIDPSKWNHCSEGEIRSNHGSCGRHIMKRMIDVL